MSDEEEDDALGARMAQKQASRDEDARRLAAGEVTRSQLQAENAFLPAEHARIDWDKVTPPEALTEEEREFLGRLSELAKLQPRPARGGEPV